MVYRLFIVLRVVEAAVWKFIAVRQERDNRESAD
jgi:hypothetical protein